MKKPFAKGGSVLAGNAIEGHAQEKALMLARAGKDKQLVEKIQRTLELYKKLDKAQYEILDFRFSIFNRHSTIGSRQLKRRVTTQLTNLG